MKETPSDSCPACDGEHSVYQCSSFKALSVNQRLNLARKKHLCFNYLGRGHSLEACPSKRSCRACGANHHTFIHRNSSPSTSSTTSANEDSSQVLFHRGSAQLHLFPAYIPVTAMAMVTAGAQQQQARVLLDSGSWHHDHNLPPSQLTQGEASEGAPLHFGPTWFEQFGEQICSSAYSWIITSQWRRDGRHNSPCCGPDNFRLRAPRSLRHQVYAVYRGQELS